MCYVRAGMYEVQPRNPTNTEGSLPQCRVGHDQLVGEVIRIEADRATIQVYEETGKK